MTPPGPGPGPNVGCAVNEWKVQSVPTSVTRGRYGEIYISELTGFPFPEGAARVHRALPWGGQSRPPLRGLHERHRRCVRRVRERLRAEIGHRLNFAPPTSGQLIKVSAATGVRTPVATGLTFPSGVAIGPDGNAYVTEFGVSKGAGRVVRIDLP